jgi:hypothetical protein
MFTQLNILCPFFPTDIEVTDSVRLRTWLGQDPGDYPGNFYSNHLKLTVWVLCDIYKFQSLV